MNIEKTYTIRGKETPISEVRETLKFYLRNAIGYPPSFKFHPRISPTGTINEDENMRCKINDIGLLQCLNKLIDNIEPSLVKIYQDRNPLSRNYRKQITETKWIIDYSGNSRIAIATRQSNYWGNNYIFDTSFRLQHQRKGFIGYVTNMSLNASQQIDRFGILTPLKTNFNRQSHTLIDLLYDLSRAE